MKIRHRDDHRPLRAKAYPDIAEQLDAIWKHLATVNDLHPETAEMLKQIQAVKDKFKKDE